MKFRVERDVIAEAVAWVARSLPNRPSIPVLAGLLLQARDGEVVVSGFDYETSARVSAPVELAEEGTALVSGRLLADISRNLPNETVEFAADGGKVVLTCRSARFTLQTLPAEEYPDLPEMPQTTGTIKGEVLAAAVAQVAVAAGRDDMLPVLTGVRVEIDGSSLTLAATDRYRLAVREFEWTPEQTAASATALVPAKVLADTAKSFGAGSDVTIALAASDSGTGEGLIGFSGDSGGGVRRMTTRLLDGEFPKYRTLFPQEQSTQARVSTSALTEALKRVALVAERNTPVRLTLDESTLTLEAGSGDEAQASESLEARIEGEPITIGFNPQYLQDGLSVLDHPVAQLVFTQSTRPAVLTGVADLEGESDEEYRYLIMPVRLQG